MPRPSKTTAKPTKADTPDDLPEDLPGETPSRDDEVATLRAEVASLREMVGKDDSAARIAEVEAKAAAETKALTERLKAQEVALAAKNREAKNRAAEDTASASRIRVAPPSSKVRIPRQGTQGERRVRWSPSGKGFTASLQAHRVTEGKPVQVTKEGYPLEIPGALPGGGSALLRPGQVVIIDNAAYLHFKSTPIGKAYCEAGALLDLGEV